MSDVGFVVAAYGLILGALAGYAALLLHRLGRDRPDHGRGAEEGE